MRNISRYQEGRRYWVALNACCKTCWASYIRTDKGTTVEAPVWFARAEQCPECAGTQRDPIPWSELFRLGRNRKRTP